LIAAILGWVYLVSAAVVALYSGSFFILVVIYFLYRHRPPATPAMPPDAEWPPVTIQLPIYNEKHVVERLIDAVAAFDYPRDKLHIQVLDDSDDATTPLLRRKIARWQAQGLQIDLLRRSSREGYKAGALAW
jgi:cellulose synthase/poly-beta-1,6-N-acetylglucosamine synthase-like glycosyltransferase